MSQTATIVGGMIQADGSLVLDEKLTLPAGRVQVVVQVLPQLPDPFWQRMQAIRAIPRSTPDDGGASTLEEVCRMREEWDEHQQEIERVQGMDPQ